MILGKAPETEVLVEPSRRFVLRIHEDQRDADLLRRHDNPLQRIDQQRFFYTLSLRSQRHGKPSDEHCGQLPRELLCEVGGERFSVDFSDGKAVVTDYRVRRCDSSVAS